jgi:hypothetical protein
MRRSFLILLGLLWVSTVQAAVPTDCLSTEEAKLIDLVNDYRQAQNPQLPPVPASKSLLQVGQWHVIDLVDNTPDTGADAFGDCNLHSWSDKMPMLWNPVCYNNHDSKYSKMWDKPREITKNLYPYNGYENAFGGSAGFIATAQKAFDGWKESKLHNDVMLELEDWNDGIPWQAMGVGIYKNYAVLWFGDVADPQGAATACGSGSGNKGKTIIPALMPILF